MKKILFAFAAAALMMVGCTQELEQRVDQLENDVTQLKSGLAALQDAVKNNLSVVDYNAIQGGYELLMSDGTKLYIYNGADGAKGDKGDKGDTGAQGPQGEKGDKGDTGATGPQGPQGEKGDKGDTGAQGEKGDKGDTGATGPQGPQGEKGEDGDAFFQSVEVVDGYLVITLVDGTVYELPLADNFNILFTLSETKVIAGETYKVPYQIVGAAESDEVVVRILSSSNCEAAVLPAEKVVSVTPALGAGYVDLYALNNTTGELKAKTISFNGDDFFEVGATTYYVSPLGGDVEVPVTTTTDYEIEIDGAWLQYTETKAIREETVVLTAAEANTTAYDKVATVTMKKGDKVLATFTVAQKNYYPEWIADEAGEPVEWAESFNLYKNADLTGDAEAKKGVFTFALSDDYTKGAYKVSNMFLADLYYGEGYQQISNKGGEYYADVEGDVLTIYMDAAVKSYGFTSDVELTYDATEKTFSAETIATYSYSTNRNVWMADYAAAVKVDAPAGEGANIAGTWNQTVAGMSWPSPSATMTITVDGSTVTLKDFLVAGTVVTATFENNQIVVPAGTMIGSGSNTAGPLDSAVVLTLEGNTFTAAPFSVGGWINVTSYSATNPDMEIGGDEPEAPSVNIAGTWNQTVVGMSWPAPSATMTITVDGSTVTLTDFVATGTAVTTTFENNQIVVPAGTMIGSGMSMAGPLDADVVLTLEGNTFTAAPFSIGGWISVSSYSATNPDMSAGEPEVPAEFATLLWKKASGPNNDPWWTGTLTGIVANADRTATTDGEYVYVAKVAAGAAGIYAIEIADPSNVKDVNMTGVTGGYFPTSCVRTIYNPNTGKNILIASAMGMNAGETVNIYAWENGIDAAPTVLCSTWTIPDWAPRRFGDFFTVCGDWTKGELWFRSMSSCTVAKYSILDGVLKNPGSPDGFGNLAKDVVAMGSVYRYSTSSTHGLIVTPDVAKYVGLNDGVEVALNTDQTYNKCFGFTPFTHNGKKYIAYTRMETAAKGKLVVISDDAADLKAALETNDVVYESYLHDTEITLSCWSSNTMANCAVATKDGVTYIVAHQQNVGVSVFKLN